jgi:hypothetical protein
MGIQSMTADEFVEGAASFIADCISEKVTPTNYQDYIERSNGKGTAEFDAMFYRSNPDMYWSLKSERLKLNKKDSDQFVAGYNQKARELGMTDFRCTERHF